MRFVAVIPLIICGCEPENIEFNIESNKIERKTRYTINGIVPLSSDSVADTWRRPRINLLLSSGQRISAMFDTGANKSKLSLDGSNAYVDRAVLPDVGNIGYKYLRFIDSGTLDVRRVVRERVNIANMPQGASLELDFHLTKGDPSLASSQHIGTGPRSNFTEAVGGFYGYLPNLWSEERRGWLALGNEAINFVRMCDSDGSLKTFPLSTGQSRFLIPGSVQIGNDVMSNQKSDWLMDTGGSPWYEVPSIIFKTVVAAIEKDGKSKYTPPSPGRGQSRRGTVTYCKDAETRFPPLLFSYGFPGNEFTIRVNPQFTKRSQPSYLSPVRSDGSCILSVEASESPLGILAISTDILDQFYFLLDSHKGQVGMCYKNRHTITQLSTV